MTTQYKFILKNCCYRNSGSGTTLGGGRLEREGFVQMFLLPCCHLSHSQNHRINIGKLNFQDHQVQLFIRQIMVDQTQ